MIDVSNELAILSGARQILMESFDAAETLRLVEAERAPILHGFDTHYKDMLDCQARDARDLSSLRFGTFPAGMLNSTAIARRSQDKLTPTVSGWGMSETWAFSACSFANATEEQLIEASGYPMPGFEFRVIDPETGRQMPPAHTSLSTLTAMRCSPPGLSSGRASMRKGVSHIFSLHEAKVCSKTFVPST